MARKKRTKRPPQPVEPPPEAVVTADGAWRSGEEPAERIAHAEALRTVAEPPSPDADSIVSFAWVPATEIVKSGLLRDLAATAPTARGLEALEAARRRYRRDALDQARQREKSRRGGQGKRGRIKRYKKPDGQDANLRDPVRELFEALRDGNPLDRPPSRTEAWRRIARESQQAWGVKVSISAVRQYTIDLPWTPSPKRSG